MRPTAVNIPAITVDSFSSPCSFTVDAQTKVAAMKELMDREGIRHLPVLENGRPVGIVSDRDLRVLMGLEKLPDSIEAGDIMSLNPYCVTEGTLLEYVAFDMSKKKIGAAIVLDKSSKVSAIFTSTDALNALVEVLRGQFEEDE